MIVIDKLLIVKIRGKKEWEHRSEDQAAIENLLEEISTRKEELINDLVTLIEKNALENSARK